MNDIMPDEFYANNSVSSFPEYTTETVTIYNLVETEPRNIIQMIVNPTGFLYNSFAPMPVFWGFLVAFIVLIIASITFKALKLNITCKEDRDILKLFRINVFIHLPSERKKKKIARMMIMLPKTFLFMFFLVFSLECDTIFTLLTPLLNNIYHFGLLISPPSPIFSTQQVFLIVLLMLHLLLSIVASMIEKEETKALVAFINKHGLNIIKEKNTSPVSNHEFDEDLDTPFENKTTKENSNDEEI